MSKAVGAAAGIAALAVVLGCATNQQMLQGRQAEAVETALARGRFELGCPSATAVVLSSDFIQPALQGPWVSGLNRLEYTVGVEGCGKRTTLIAICQQETGSCFAANPDSRLRAL